MAALKLPGANQQPEGCISITMGISDCPGDAGNAEDLVSVADQALYYGKCHGRNQIVRARENREAIEKESEDRREAEKI
ncbi:MAG: diguanylate cyclase [Planctomycetes bacterium]|nr:diguanylate cyclase [Planctomycetota bacterium]